jgi:hypothetical protein
MLAGAMAYLDMMAITTGGEGLADGALRLDSKPVMLPQTTRHGPVLRHEPACDRSRSCSGHAGAGDSAPAARTSIFSESAQHRATNERAQREVLAHARVDS